MGVYIKGMEMPIIEMEWTIRHEADGKWYAIDTNAETSDGEWHEIVPVPPHGRLSDADALWMEINKICDRRDAGIISDLTCLQQLLSAFRHDPTIIPAEEGET